MVAADAKKKKKNPSSTITALPCRTFTIAHILERCSAIYNSKCAIKNYLSHCEVLFVRRICRRGFSSSWWLCAIRTNQFCATQPSYTYSIYCVFMNVGAHSISVAINFGLGRIGPPTGGKQQNISLFNNINPKNNTTTVSAVYNSTVVQTPSASYQIYVFLLSALLFSVVGGKFSCSRVKAVLLIHLGIIQMYYNTYYIWYHSGKGERAPGALRHTVNMSGGVSAPTADAKTAKCVYACAECRALVGATTKAC